MGDTKLKQAVIIAGGRGIRMRNQFPWSKPMTPIMNKPLVSFTIDALIHCGIDDIKLFWNPNYPDILDITDYNKEYKNKIEFIPNKEQIGIMSAIDYTSQLVKTPYLLSMADIITQKDDFKKMVAYGMKLSCMNPDMVIQTVDNPSIVGDKMMTVVDGKIVNWELDENAKSGAEIFLVNKTPIPKLRKFIASGNENPHLFFKEFVKHQNVWEMPINDMWDVDTPEEVERTQNILLEKQEKGIQI